MPLLLGVSGNASLSPSPVQRLPVELFQSILDFADLSTVQSLRMTQRHYRDLIDSSPVYRRLKVNAQNLIHTLSRVELLRDFSIGQLADITIPGKCQFCDQAGCFLFVLTMTCACESCLTNDRRLWSVDVSTASRTFLIPESVLETLPTRRVHTKCPKELISMHCVRKLHDVQEQELEQTSRMRSRYWDYMERSVCTNRDDCMMMDAFGRWTGRGGAIEGRRDTKERLMQL